MYLLIFVIILISAGVLVLLRKFAGGMNNESLIETIITCVFVKGCVSIGYGMVYVYGAE